MKGIFIGGGWIVGIDKMKLKQTIKVRKGKVDYKKQHSWPREEEGGGPL